MRIRRSTTIAAPVAFSSACFSQDGRSVITTRGALTQYWDVETGQECDTDSPLHAKNECDKITAVWTLKQARGDSGFLLSELAGSGDIGFVREPFPDVAGACVSPDGRFIAIGYQHGRLRVEAIPAAAPVFLNGHDTTMNNHMQQNEIAFLEFDYRSRLLVSMAEEDGSPLLWDLQQQWQPSVWNHKRAFRIDSAIALNSVTDGGIDTLRFSPTAALFVCTHRYEKTAQVWQYYDETGSA